jgi:hypothetical protein
LEFRGAVAEEFHKGSCQLASYQLKGRGWGFPSDF